MQRLVPGVRNMVLAASGLCGRGRGWMKGAWLIWLHEHLACGRTILSCTLRALRTTCEYRMKRSLFKRPQRTWENISWPSPWYYFALYDAPSQPPMLDRPYNSRSLERKTSAWLLCTSCLYSFYPSCVAQTRTISVMIIAIHTIVIFFGQTLWGENRS